MARMMD